MKSEDGFGPVLTRIRREQGFVNAHGFYRSRDGGKNLGLTFANYLKVERGAALPKVFRLKGIIQALGLSMRSPQAGELVRAYVASLLKSEDLLEAFGAQAAPAPDLDPRRLAEDAARQSLTQRTVQLSLEQWAAMAKDPQSYACHTYLVNTPEWVAIGDLAKATGIEAGKVKKALKSLAAAGVVELLKEKARSPFVRMHMKLPAPLPAAAALSAALYRYREGWIKKGARLAGMHSLTVRMEKKNLERYLHQLTEAVNLSAVYGDVEKTPETGIYLVEGRVYGLFP